MPMKVEGSLIDLVADLNYAVEMGAPFALQNAARLLHEKIMYAFRVDGPGWQRLSKLTIRKKKLRGAPRPTKILEEFETMKNSIEIRDESTVAIEPVIKMTTGMHVVSIGSYRWSYKKTFKSVVGAVMVHDYAVGVGLYEDSYSPTVLKREKNKKGEPFFRKVSRGIIHEYGGFEKQVEELGPIEEVRTGRLKARALRGEQDVEKFGHEVKKKRIGKKRKFSKIVRIPSRSFMRMPFDMAEEQLYDVVINTMVQVLEDVLL